MYTSKLTVPLAIASALCKEFSMLQQCLNNSTPCRAAVMQGMLPSLSQAQLGAPTHEVFKKSKTQKYLV